MYILVIFIITIILMLIAFLRYRYLLKYSDKEFVQIYIFIITSLLFSGFGFIPIVESIINRTESENLLFGILIQLPLIISITVYAILSVKYKKRIAVVTKIVENEEWK